MAGAEDKILCGGTGKEQRATGLQVLEKRLGEKKRGEQKLQFQRRGKGMGWGTNSEGEGQPEKGTKRA